jgi:DNA-binding IscR family transcriptional regulator
MPEISEKQAIPIRFLEVILHPLKGTGFVQSKRGFEGGYYRIR